MIIVTWKRDDLLADCLQSLQKVYGTLPRTVVVDNAHLQSTADLVSSIPGIRYVAATDNLGFAGGNNLGMKYCDREFALLLNNDTIFLEDSISPLVDFMDAHPRAAVLQGRDVYADNPLLLDGAGMYFSSIGTIRYPGDRLPVDGPYDHTRLMPAAGGACCLFRCAALASIGGELYHDFFWAYCEDVDLSLRAWRGGNEVWYVASPAVLHRKSLTAKMFSSEKICEHVYFNLTASYLSCFDWHARLRFCAIRYGCYFIKSIAYLCLFRLEYARIHLRVLSRLWRERRTLADLHARLAPCRKLSDRELLRLFHKLMRWEDFV